VTEREVTSLRIPQPPAPDQLIRSVSLGGVDKCFLQTKCSRSSQLCHSCYTGVGGKLQPAQAGFTATLWRNWSNLKRIRNKLLHAWQCINQK